MVKTLQVNGNRGEITPLMHARFDTEFYQAGYAQARNTVITRYGPHTRVPGTILQSTTKFANKKSRMLPFEFSETQVYALEFGDLYVRFWTPEGQIMIGMAPYEIVSGYTEADLPFLHGRQSGDALYLFCKGKRPQLLKRASETSWSFEAYKPKDGPYLDINDTPTTMTLGGTGNVVPLMTTNTAPSPAVASSTSSPAALFNVFARNKTFAGVAPSAAGSGYMQIDLGAGNAKAMDLYTLIATPNNHYTDVMFSQWDLAGSNNGTDWTTIDSRDGERGWTGSETRYYETANKQSFRYYRLTYSGGGSSAAAAASLSGWYMHQTASTQTPVTLTASSTTGINKNTGFKTTDVGRPIRLQGTDGKWRWAEIVAYTSTTQVTVVINGHAFLETNPIQNWRMGAWSDTDGWPRTGRFFEDRLVLSSWPNDPIGLALSVSAAYNDFRTSSPIVEDDALLIRATGGRLDPIHWMAETGTLLAGTGGGLRSVGSRDNASVLKNDNLRQKLETSTAASMVQPVQIENIVLFVDRLMRRLYEVGYTYDADAYVAQEVSVLNDHLFKPGVGQVDYVDAPYKIVLARRTDGKVVFFSYDREQKIAGGTLVDWGGVVEDLMVLPGPDYPEVWLTVKRVRDGADVRYIEKMAPFWDGEIDPDAAPVYSACSYTYEGAPAAGLTGLLALAGQTVGIWADGTDIGDAVVDALGAVTLPYEKAGSSIVVGERLPWRIQTLRIPQASQGPALGDKLRIVTAHVDLFESARVYGGGLSGVELLRDEDYSEHDPDLPEPILTGLMSISADDSFKNEGVFVISGDSMYPATIRAITLEVESEP